MKYKIPTMNSFLDEAEKFPRELPEDLEVAFTSLCMAEPCTEFAADLSYLRSISNSRLCRLHQFLLREREIYQRLVWQQAKLFEPGTHFLAEAIGDSIKIDILSREITRRG